jgi:4-diphosphocytidyl-2-C-methyl-D-erythritol kinase
MTSARIRVPAPAKVNLSLHVRGRRDDGYHLLESLVVFAEIGDVVELEVTAAESRAQESESVIIAGPFASALHASLVAGTRLSLETAYETARAAARPRRFRVDVKLVKNLPVAAGLGGGASDGAAALKALAEAFELDWDEAEIAAAALAIGADGPACVHARPLVMGGIGEEISDLKAWPDLDVVLVNPGAPLSTRAVFDVYAAHGADFSGALAAPPATRNRDEALDYLAATRNDLLAAAASIEPEVMAAIDALERQSGARLVRLSGSGATCWGVFDDGEAAARAAEEIRRARPSWWLAATRLKGTA